ncbi:acyl carrier protein [Paenibacillus xylaniclasticus]|uniref:acyl carrier protein n=1 Tax=Paenibacillus xylaniclasticus TaxID=588083 RepID=UPI0035A2599C
MSSEEALIRLICDIARRAEVQPHFRLDSDLGLQSLQIMQLIVKIETVFDIEFPDSFLNTLSTKTVAELIEIVESLCQPN